jgi:hypothetical protein
MQYDDSDTGGTYQCLSAKTTQYAAAIRSGETQSIKEQGFFSDVGLPLDMGPVDSVE